MHNKAICNDWNKFKEGKITSMNFAPNVSSNLLTSSWQNQAVKKSQNKSAI